MHCSVAAMSAVDIGRYTTTKYTGCLTFSRCNSPEVPLWENAPTRQAHGEVSRCLKQYARQRTHDVLRKLYPRSTVQASAGSVIALQALILKGQHGIRGHRLHAFIAMYEEF